MPTRALLVSAGLALLAAVAPSARAAFAIAQFFPANAATAVCPDTPLRLAFSAAPTFGAAGKIRIFDADTRAAVETFDLAAPLLARKTIGGLDGFNYSTAIIAGDEVTLIPKPGALAYGKRYYVTMDPAVFKNGSETTAALDDRAAWHFSTKAAPPAAGLAKLIVAADGSGDFCTVQGALDHVPEGNTRPVTLLLRAGTYREIIFFTDKHAVTILGEDRKKTVIAGANNATFNPSGGNPFATRANPSAENPRQGGSVYRRGLFLAHRVQDFTLANLTLRNTTPQGGSQAEALIVNGSTDARTIIRDVDFYSYQDTVQINGQAYLAHCHIEGDVDFMWGTGPSFFANCTVRSLRSGAFYTQVRNPATNRGFVYSHCVFDGAPGVADNFLSRIEPHRFPHSEVVLLDCILGPAVGATGWQLQPPPKDTAPGETHQLHFWEFNSRTPDGRPTDVSQRLGVSRQLQVLADAALLADYASPTFVLGHDWNPLLAPIFR